MLDLANLVNIGAIKAAVDGVDKITAAHLEFAKDRMIMGTERKAMFISEESRKVSMPLLLLLFLKYSFAILDKFFMPMLILSFSSLLTMRVVMPLLHSILMVLMLYTRQPLSPEVLC